MPELVVILVLGFFLLILAAKALQIIRPYEKGVVETLGKYSAPPREPGAPLPRMVLDGVLQARFAGDLCQECRLWWHSQPVPA